MHFPTSLLATLALTLSTTSAVPNPFPLALPELLKPPTKTVSATFYGAPPNAASYQIKFPVLQHQDYPQEWDKSLSISHIKPPKGVQCVCFKDDNAVVLTYGKTDDLVAVSPPQPMVAGFCFPHLPHQ